MITPTHYPSNRIIPAHDLNVVVDGNEFIAAAKRAANQQDTVTAEAQAEARVVGYSEGFAQGRIEGSEALVREASQLRASWSANKDNVLALVGIVLRKLLGSIDSEVLVEKAVSRALAEVSAGLYVTFLVPPDDFELVKGAVSNLRVTYPDTNIDIRVDPSLKTGQIAVELPHGRVHVGPRQLLARFEAGLK
jgi:flagellar biosynthesis/type III secretory pathway protein FliH